MSKKKFHVNVRKFVLAKKVCRECDKCYIEQLWRDIGDCNNCHCSRTKAAFFVALNGKDRDMEEHSLPEKDECIVATLKTGQHVCVKLFYDNENKPCMYYDDFDNWYSISDVTFVDFVLPEYVDIEVED